MKTQLLDRDTQQITKLALIAGKGELPLRLAESASREGVEVVVFALNGQTYRDLKDSYETYRFTPIEVLGIVNKIKQLGIRHMVHIGKVPKMDFFKNIHKLDKELLGEVKKLGNYNDDSIHFRLLDFLEKEHGLKVVDQTKYLQEYFAGEEVFTVRTPNNGELEEIQYGLEMAKGIAALDIGQTVVVHKKAVIGVEAIEGTNACIRKAVNNLGIFAKDRRVIVAKVSKPDQDNRFDVPTVGLQTLKAMPKGSILAFEAGETFFVNQAQAIDYANSKNMIIISKKMS